MCFFFGRGGGVHLTIGSFFLLFAIDPTIFAIDPLSYYIILTFFLSGLTKKVNLG